MSILILLLPLISSLICGLFNKVISKKSASIIACISAVISSILSIILFYGMIKNPNIENIHLMDWFTILDKKVSWSLYCDQLTVIMFFVVTSVSAVVHIYSTGYMDEDPNLPRFMSYLSLFTFFMLLLVSSNNFLQLFVGWEGVGLCSYLLIGFWYAKPSACAASIKAFVVNRIGDMAFILGIVLILYYYGSVNFIEVFEYARSKTINSDSILNTIDVICILLFIGATGKSAQIGLHVWLADAMEGPTPVSALIHAATMVTAGVFLVVRCSFLFELSPISLNIIAIVGAVTCLFAGTIAVTQNDIKKVIAYSTSSQLGYMFLACGVSAYRAAIFHLVTHAFFKAMLFLCAGNVIHASGEQDIRKLGGIFKKLPYTYILFWIGSLAIMGIYPLAGYYSKDMILESVAASDRYGLFIIALFGAFFTACYSIKLIIMTFHGKTKLPLSDLNNIHESVLTMILPLILLAFGAISLGYLGQNYLQIGNIEGYLGSSVVATEKIHEISQYLKLLPLFISVCGIILSIIIFNRNVSERIYRYCGVIGKIVSNKYYFDEIYNIVFVKKVRVFGKISAFCDEYIIDRIGPGLAIYFIRKLTKVTKAIQTGYIFNYALFMLLGFLITITWFLVNYITKIL